MKVEAFLRNLTLHHADFELEQGYGVDREPVLSLTKANVSSSLRTDQPGKHAVLLDLDVPALLLPSSTAGHSHLYVDIACSWEDYLFFLQAATKIGLIEPGYAAMAEMRGYTSLRLPWVRKDVAR
jgi:hypothetical protein